MKIPSLLLAGAALAALTSCNLAPHYQAPAADTPAAFKEAVPNADTPATGWKQATPEDAALRGNWWELYQDPDLNALEERVAISNQTVAAAEANYRAAQALANEARAGWYPTIGIDPSVTRSRSSAASGGSSTGTGTTVPSSGNASANPATRTLYSLPLEASYEIDLWGKVRNQSAQSTATAQADAAEVAAALLSTRSQLAQDYFQLRAVDEQRRILDSTLNDYETSRKLVDTLYTSGLASDEDRAAADAQLDAAEAQATDLGITRAQFEHAIATLIGVPPAQFSLGVKAFNPALPTVPVGLPSALLERRPDIAVAERNVAAANAGIGIARAAYFPSLTLNASLGYQSNGLSRLFDWPDRFWSVGPALAETLFDGGARRAVTAQARAEYDQTVANYRQTVLTALQSTEDNLTSLRILATEEGQQHRAAAAAEDQVRLSVARYKLGLDSYVNVITAQNGYLTNREAELEVQVRRLSASINLVANLGGGWEPGQLSVVEKAALHEHPPGPDVAPPPAEAGPGIPNPPPPPPELKPQDLVSPSTPEAAPAASPAGP